MTTDVANFATAHQVRVAQLGRAIEALLGKPLDTRPDKPLDLDLTNQQAFDLMINQMALLVSQAQQKPSPPHSSSSATGQPKVKKETR